MTSSHLLNKETISNVDTSLTNTDLSNLSNTGESHFQTPLISGNNIKTINSTSLLGSGDIIISAGAPTGSIMIWAGTTVPEGYLLCDGSAVSRTTYSALFSAIGTTYGAGDSSTTFNLPNLNFLLNGVKGNGKSLGLTNGTDIFGFRSGQANVVLNNNGYDVTLPQSLSGGDTGSKGAFGITTDETKSGLTILQSNTIKYIIKY